MSKWEDSFRKTPIDNNGSKVCHCSDSQGLFVPNRQLSFAVAGFLFLAFSIFMAGYFLGKKKAVEQFTERMQQDAFADQIYTTVLSTTQDLPSATNSLLVASLNDDVVPSQLVSHDEIVLDNAVLEDNAQHYYAQLIGFGTEKAAQLFVKKLSVKGIETEVKKRISKTVKGHSSYWYQVVTAPYTNKNDLTALVDRLAKEENIKDACIRNC